MRPDYVETEVCEQNKAESFDDVQLIGDLRIDLNVVVVVWRVVAAKKRNRVEGEVEKKEKEVIYDETANKLQC